MATYTELAVLIFSESHRGWGKIYFMLWLVALLQICIIFFIGKFRKIPSCSQTASGSLNPVLALKKFPSTDTTKRNHTQLSSGKNHEYKALLFAERNDNW